MRDKRIDGIKGLLIILVVFGHFTELCGGGTSSALYLIIYSFHMPAFVFISGYLTKRGIKRIFKFYLPVYIFNQFLYLVFDELFIGKRELCIEGFLVPYWHLWYIFSLVLYRLLLPFLSRCDGKMCFLAVMLSTLLSVIFPLTGTNLYFLSIGRFFAFLPFFVLGHFCGNGKLYLFSMPFLVPISLIFVLCEKGVNARLLYGSLPYSEPREIILKGLLIIFAVSWISLLFNIGNYPDILCKIGKNTLPVYLLHGYFQRLLLVHGMRIDGEFTVFIISLLLCISLSKIKIKSTIDNIKNMLYNILKKGKVRLLKWKSE